MPKLTSKAITEATGEENHSRITDIEIIFHPFEEIDSLEECPNLRSFAMIAGKLQMISNLNPVGNTLSRLCLCGQQLTKMENLNLPNLKQLLLHENKISKIEGLKGCPKLQKLWLFDNNITKVENLLHCPDLREIWMQKNLISELSGFENLMNLQNLALSNNNISQFSSLQVLSSLASLRDLSLTDEHFGCNPIVKLKRLDGQDIKVSDKDEAENTYMKNALRFNDQIDAIQQEHEREMLAIDSRRNRNGTQSDILRNEVMKAFKELEKIVITGRDEISAEYNRQQDIRQKNRVYLEENLNKIKKDYMLHINKVIKEKESEMKLEEELCNILKEQLLAEQSQALMVSSIQSEGSRKFGIVFQHLSDHSPEFRFVASFFVRSEATSHSTNLRVLQIYKVYNENQCEIFQQNSSGLENIEDCINNIFDQNRSICRLFLINTQDVLRATLIEGVKAFRSDCIKYPILLFSDPKMAVKVFGTMPGNLNNMPEENRTSEKGAPKSGVCGFHELLLCQARNFSTASILSLEKIESFEKLQNSISTFSPKMNPLIQIKYGHEGGDECGSIYLADHSCSGLILPHYHILSLSQSKFIKYEEKIDDMMQELSLSDVDGSIANNLKHGDIFLNTKAVVYADPVLADFEEQAGLEIKNYQRRIWQEMDPETALHVEHLDEEATRIQETMRNLRSHIDIEKEAQEDLLKNYRNISGVDR